MNSEKTFDQNLETVHGLTTQVMTNVNRGVYQGEPFAALWGCINWEKNMVAQLAGEG